MFENKEHPWSKKKYRRRHSAQDPRASVDHESRRHCHRRQLGVPVVAVQVARNGKEQADQDSPVGDQLWGIEGGVTVDVGHGHRVGVVPVKKRVQAHAMPGEDVDHRIR